MQSCVFADLGSSDCRSAAALAENYTLVGTRYYREVEGDVTDAQGRAICQAEGADMVMFKTEDDWNEVTEFFGKYLSVYDATQPI